MQVSKLGPYEILKPIGKGGMGSVYEAIDTRTGQRVAIKALSPQMAHAEGFRERFEAEIESLKTLRHEGIVRLYGYGEQDGVLFYSMELVDGTSLEDELKAGRRFQWREVTDIAIQLCLALKHAHDHGVVHRDIKPANVLVTAENRVKLADFGIARLFGSSQLTSAGGVLGTADYMAPEQADGRPVTARCDQYSLGCVMYALLAGRPPFRARTLPEMLQFQRFAEPEPVRRYADQTPEQLERVILQLLSKDPADRFPNTQVLARHLQAMVKGLSRPPADGFTLSDDGAAESTTPKRADSVALAATQLEAETDELPEENPDADVLGRPSSGRGSHEAATLAPDELEMADREAEAPPETVLPKAASPAKAARFTTLEEEQARHAQQHRSWHVIGAQFLGLVLMLAGLAGLGLYLARPPTADELYDKITANIDPEQAESVRDVQQEVEEFLSKYPEDPRAPEIQTYMRQVRLDRAERRLQLQARRGGLSDPTLLPVEVLYLQAVSKAQQSPEEAIAMFDSLVQLYGASANDDVDDESPQTRQAACVELAKRQSQRLRVELAKHAERQLADLEERLAVAEALSATDPAGAQAIYSAIVDLYQDQLWAEEIVAEARLRLENLPAMEDRQQDRETGRPGDEKAD